MKKTILFLYCSLLIVYYSRTQSITADTTLANKYYNISIDFFKTDDYTNALSNMDSAKTIYTKYLGNNTKRIAEILSFIGTIEFKNNELDSAIANYRNSIIIYEKIFGEYNSYAGKFYHIIGNIYWRKADYPNSLECYSKALSINKKILGDNNIQIANGYHNLGNIFRVYGDLNKSLDYYLLSLKIRKSILEENHILISQSYNNIGIVNAEKNNYENALLYFNLALKMNKILYGENHLEIAQNYINIGVIYEKINDYDKALGLYYSAFNIINMLYGNNHENIADIYNNISAIYRLIDQYDLSLEYLFKSLNIRKKIFGDIHNETAFVYNNIGVLYREKEEFDLALKYHSKSIEIQKELFGEKHPDIANNYFNIGSIYFDKKEYELALEYIQKSLEIDSVLFEENHEKTATCYLMLGNIYGFNGNYSLSLDYLNKSLRIFQFLFEKKHSYLSHNYYFLGKIHHKFGNYYNALESYQKGIYSILHTCIVDTNDFFILPVICDYIEWDFLLQNIEGKAQTFLSIDTLPPFKRYFLALRHYQACDTLITKSRCTISNEKDKIELGRKASQIYSEAIDVCLQLAGKKKANIDSSYYYKQLAFHFSEKAKSMVLMESMAEKEGREMSGIPDTVLQREKRLKIDISLYEKKLSEEPDSLSEIDFRNKLFDANRQYEELISMLEKDYPQYYNLKYNYKTTEINELQSKLNKNTAIVEYSLFDSILYVSVISKNKFDFKKIEIDSNFNKSLEDYYLTLSRLNKTKTSPKELFSTYSKLSYYIYNQIIKPIDIELKDISSLVIIPSGNLQMLPFESLITSRPDKKNTSDYSQLSYLAQKYTISYHYSASLWAEGVGRKAKNKSDMTAFGGFAPVNFSNEISITRRIYSEADTTLRALKFNNLPNSAIEVDSISRLFKKAGLTSEPYLKNAATKENFTNKSSKYKILHLSTHAYFNKKFPQLSGIAFYPVDNQSDTASINFNELNDNSFLFTGESYNLNLNADLVVLGACETGLGQLISGEGMMGINRGFFYSGARNIIYSLFSLNDKSTTDLFIKFYNYYIQGNTYKESLRLAKTEMIKNKNYTPKDWCGVVLLGE